MSRSSSFAFTGRCSTRRSCRRRESPPALHVSKREQERRLLERLDNPAKNWKFSTGDLLERAQWKAYRDAYTEALAFTRGSPASINSNSV